MFPESPAVRRTIIRFLTDMADADNFTHPFEWRYIMNVADELGFSEEEVKSIRNTADFEAKVDDDEQGNMNILYRLLFLARFDNEMSEKEVEMVHRLGLKLGMREDFLDEMVVVMRRYLGEKMPQNALLDVVKAYLN